MAGSKITGHSILMSTSDDKDSLSLKNFLSSYQSFFIKSNREWCDANGCDINSECVELLINGNAVLQATGKCKETMERILWDVTPYIGETAQLRLVDGSSGGWGHINFDDVKFE